MTRIILLLLLFPCLCKAQTVTTISTNSGVTDELIFDLDGHLLGADYNGSAVFRVTLPDGNSEVFSDGYNTPNGMAYDSNGTLYMADNQGNTIYKIFPDGSSEVFVEFYNPSGLIFELDSDTLIATSYYGDKLAKIAPDGTMTDWSVGGELSGGPVGLCYDDEDNLYVGNFDNRRITKILPDGSQVSVAQGPTSGWLGFIEYANGYIYGTLFSTHKIFRTDLEGNVEIILGSTAGNTDGDASMAQFNAPNGILASPSGDTLYVSDLNSSNIRMITDLDAIPSKSNEAVGISSFRVSPNPAVDVARLGFELAVPARASLAILNAEGKLVSRVLDNQKLGAGQHQFDLACHGWPSGVYHAVLELDGKKVRSEKLVLVN